MASRSRPLAALGRSLRVYHGDADRNARMDALYANFLKAGDLAFDIGAHVGDRISSFRRVGARVVALEPQPRLARAIEVIHGRDPDVFLLRAAAGEREGDVTLHVNSANPTVSTASHDFIRAADGAPGWEQEVWDETITVPCVTLDRLMAEHGRPAFIKIDVEGFEDRVLAGLSWPVPALSFEFTTIARDVAQRCLDQLAALGPYRFDLALGESQRLEFQCWVNLADMSAHLRELPHEANSGDVYALLDNGKAQP
jgi:FkbM family methyltransferase